MFVILKDNEKIDELGINNLKIIQNDNFFKYGTDAVILSKFANIKKNSKVIDLCTGSGIIPIMLIGLEKTSEVLGIEYFPEVCDMARRTVSLNNLCDKCEIICGDVKNIKEYITEHSFDHVTVNPPYKISNTGLENENIYKKAARHEILISLKEVIKSANYALKFGGKMTMVNRIDRLTDTICFMREEKIEPKRLSFVSTGNGTSPKIFVVEGIYGGKNGITVEPDIIL